jgi:hypothetical protein
VEAGVSIQIGPPLMIGCLLLPYWRRGGGILLGPAGRRFSCSFFFSGSRIITAAVRNASAACAAQSCRAPYVSSVINSGQTFLPLTIYPERAHPGFPDGRFVFGLQRLVWTAGRDGRRFGKLPPFALYFWNFPFLLSFPSFCPTYRSSDMGKGSHSTRNPFSGGEQIQPCQFDFEAEFMPIIVE